MMGNFCGTKVFPEIGYVPLSDELNQMFWTCGRYFFEGDTGMAKTYYLLEGKRNLYITSAKGEGFLWSEKEKLWLQTEPIYTFAIELQSVF